MAGPAMFVATIAFTLVLSAAFATWLVRGFHNWWIEHQPNLPFACYALGMVLGWLLLFFTPSYIIYRLMGGM